MYVCRYVCRYMYACMYVGICICMHVCMHTCIYAYTGLNPMASCSADHFMLKLSAVNLVQGDHLGMYLKETAGSNRYVLADTEEHYNYSNTQCGSFYL